MNAKLNLIKSEVSEIEKRVFPRFPFTFMTFKPENGENNHVFEVVDISLTGMQISLKNGGHNYIEGSILKGELHWKGAHLNIEGQVKWSGASNLGLAFDREKSLNDRIQAFLCVDNIINSMKPLHNNELGLEIPGNLKYWLRSDGPFELFLWQHNDGELARFQVIMMDNFIEWEDGKGVKTGYVVKRRDIDSPLLTEDEFLFEIDEVTNEQKVNNALNLVEKIPGTYLPQQALEFLCVKLGGHPVATPC